MVETRALYTVEDYEKDKGNVERLTGRKPTSLEDFVRREIPRYFKYWLLLYIEQTSSIE
jgi:hypothetical protein